jgi:hypothetical protein
MMQAEEAKQLYIQATKLSRDIKYWIKKIDKTISKAAKQGRKSLNLIDVFNNFALTDIPDSNTMKDICKHYEDCGFKTIQLWGLYPNIYW